MQYKRVVMFYLVSLPVSIILRLLQLKYILDAKTGFFLPELSFFGYAILVIFFLVALLLILFSFTTHRSPEHSPQPKMPISIASFIAATGIFLGTFGSDKQFSLHTLVLNIFALLSIAFFISFALKKYFDFKIPNIAFLIPCVYFVFKIIYNFTITSSISVISDNIILFAGYCSSMVFFLQFAKLYNNVDSELNFRKLLASGLVSSFFCFVQSIPYFIFNALTDTPNNHTSFSDNLGLLCIGIFISVFIASHFSRKNACIEI